MVDILEKISLSMKAFPQMQPILLLDCAPCHTHWEVIAKGNATGIWLCFAVAPSQFAEYLEVRAAEPCGKSIPVSILKTLVFMENAAEIPKEEQVGQSLAVKNALEELVLQLESQSVPERRQARCLDACQWRSSLPWKGR